VNIQIWSPGLEALSLVQGATQAKLTPQALADPAALTPDQPLLLAYADPLAWCGEGDPTAPAAGAGVLLSALPAIVATGMPCRLVNLSCLTLPALVAWCIDPTSPPPPVGSPRFLEPEAFDALMAIEWLQVHPEQLQAYQALEAHPLAAALEQRPPDLNCLERYRQAARLEALLQARHERAALEADLAELAQQLQPLQQQQLEALALREQLALL
jgi:hypothetical protein